ncbi:3D-(3,5/4)-trihydroxycyclohexane-1,2-dione acylhydrolase (decyclizing) [Balneatrix alpica]|uniref:3D-(3,5/4)-trihydroxycyclohexane-1,2-dione acylhydrolase (decyclizing) n=1 Tax=Balneatrix alpica TaxID=75684 RepID=UPI002739D64E|nr:3D-(3,5/4)-trihydroxycyclohexane-1,2-dione acylhydrolase (decyclizing) [Balneatrix alpica]
MASQRLTLAQALVRYLQAQFVEVDGQELPLCAGMFAIFGHGNVAGLGEALQQVQPQFPTYRAHNEQGMALAAIAYAKQQRRRRFMACTSSIGPGATNMVTAAALAYVNRLPVLLLPGDTFASRTPDPVLQQLEQAGDPTLSVNDCFKPVSRYFDRIQRPEQLITSLPAAIRVLTDPADCGPVTLALPQDVQTQAYDFPDWFFARKVHRLRRPQPDTEQLAAALAQLAKAKRPLLIAGGGVHYSGAVQALQQWVEATGIPVAETQAGKGVLPWDHPQLLGALGVTGSSAANRAAAEADLIIAVGTRLQDFTTGSRTLFSAKPLLNLNVSVPDAYKHEALPLVADAQVGLMSWQASLPHYQVDPAWREHYQGWQQEWLALADAALAAPNASQGLPSDAQVIGAVLRGSDANTTVVCAAGGLPGELHKLWRPQHELGYHLEYGFSCMGYEIAGGLGVKMASPEREVVVMVGDGSYLMMNSEIATSVMLGHKLIIVLLDNRGFGCINRLQRGCGGESFNNLLQDCLTGPAGAPKTDFASHARALGAQAEQVSSITELEAAFARARASQQTYLIAIDTDPMPTTAAGGNWWEVAVAEVSTRPQVAEARARNATAKQQQPY